MNLLLSSVLLGLAWFSALNLLTSALLWPFARLLARREPVGANTLLAVRLLPAVVSCSFVTAFFLPAHWRFEPRGSDESFGVLLGMLAAVGLAVLGRSAWRAAATAWVDHRLRSLARQAAVPLQAGALEVPGFQGVSLAGILRPTILVGTETIAALTPAELDAAIAHEIAHRRSADNFKRFLMFCAPDVFGWSTAARNLEERWVAEAECQADARAVDGDDRRALILASALVKVARLTRRPGALMPLPAWSAFHLAALLERRVRRLTAGAAAAQPGGGRLWGGVALTVAGLAAGAWLLEGSYVLHLVTEAMVTRLP